MKLKSVVLVFCTLLLLAVWFLPKKSEAAWSQNIGWGYTGVITDYHTGYCGPCGFPWYWGHINLMVQRWGNNVINIHYTRYQYAKCVKVFESTRTGYCWNNCYPSKTAEYSSLTYFVYVCLAAIGVWLMYYMLTALASMMVFAFV